LPNIESHCLSLNSHYVVARTRVGVENLGHRLALNSRAMRRRFSKFVASRFFIRVAERVDVKYPLNDYSSAVG
jgi:hypothetical protein